MQQLEFSFKYDKSRGILQRFRLNFHRVQNWPEQDLHHLSDATARPHLPFFSAFSATS